MTESTPPEGQQPLTQAQIRELHRSLTEQVLDRAASDPEFRQLLIDDPELAMREANFPAAQQLGQRGAPQEQEAEVTGSAMAMVGAAAAAAVMVIMVMVIMVMAVAAGGGLRGR